MSKQIKKDILYIPKYGVRKSIDGLLYEKVPIPLERKCEACHNKYASYTVFVYLNSLKWSVRIAMDEIDLCNYCYKQIKKRGIKPFIERR
jgi:hypothetical protein